MTAESGLKGFRDGKIGGLRGARDVGAARGVHGDCVARVTAATAQVGGVDERRAVGGKLGDECFSIAFVSGIQLAKGLDGFHGRELHRMRLAGYIGVAGSIHGDATDFVGVTATEVGGKENSRAIGCDLGDESVSVAARSGLKRMEHREVRRGGRASDVDISGRVERDGVGAILAASAQIRGESNRTV